MTKGYFKRNYVHVVVRPETKQLLINDVQELYRAWHPELDHIPLSQDKLLYELCMIYLDNFKK